MNLKDIVGIALAALIMIGAALIWGPIDDPAYDSSGSTGIDAPLSRP